MSLGYIFLRLKKFINLLLLIILIYFIVPFPIVGYYAIFYSSIQSHKKWTSSVSRLLGITYKYMENSKQPQTNKRTIFLINHRTQADFFVHDVISGHSSNYLARFMVGIVFPQMYLMTNFITRSVWFFKRGGNNLDKQLQLIPPYQRFFIWIDKQFQRSYRQNLVVYPEGHRMSKSDKPAPLKKGMIQYAYERKIDCQIIICFGQELSYNEKELSAYFGPNEVAAYVDDIIRPQAFQTFQEFYEHIDVRFKDLFEKTYTFYLSRQKKL